MSDWDYFKEAVVSLAHSPFILFLAGIVLGAIIIIAKEVRR